MTSNSNLITSDESLFVVGPNVKILDINNPDVVLTSAEINARVEQLTYGVMSISHGHDVVALAYENSYEWLCLWCALCRAGKTIVLINFKLPPDQIEYCLKDAGCTFGFVGSELVKLMPATFTSVVINSSEYAQLMHYPVADLPTFDPDKPNCIMYTSGTTGFPKGVVMTYKSRIIQNRPKIIEDESLKKVRHSKFLHVSPLYHLAGLNGLLMNVTTDSNTLAIMVPKFDVPSFIDAIDRFKVTDLRLVTPMMSMILAREDLLSKADLSSVKSIFLTSSLATRKIKQDVKAKFTNLRDINNPYGLTETGAVFGSHPLGLPTPPDSAGYPLTDVECKIVDGVLHVKSPTLLKTYHNKEDQYSQVMSEDGFFITNDLFRVNKYGFYFYMGRSDDMFKSGGEKIYPTEIESVIDRLPQVASSAIVGFQDDIKGFKPYGYVVLKQGMSLTEKDIMDFVIPNVATYQIPRKIWILDELPMTNIGKIDRRKLTSMVEERLATSA